MKYRSLITSGVALTLLLTALSACGTVGTATVGSPAAAQATVTAPVPTAPTAPTAPTSAPTAAPLPAALSGSGAVTAGREARIGFLVAGQVLTVTVEEGAAVRRGDLLAALDPRPFDEQVRQAEAALTAARAQRAGLNEAANPADVRAAQAQVRQAEIALAQTRSTDTKDTQAAETNLTSAQTQAQQARDQLSAAKNQAAIQVQQAAAALTQAQAQYAQAKSNWEYAQETGNDPITPKVPDAEGKLRSNKLSDGQREAYYAAFVQADAALRQAEQQVQQASLGYETARKAEVTGVQAAEQQVQQAQTELSRLQVPLVESRTAAAQAALEAARASAARLNPNPTGSQREQADAAIAQAEVALALAKLNREYAELRAPFDGVIASRGVQAGEQAAPGTVAFHLVDIGSLRFEATVADVDIGQVSVGQQASVRLDAFADAPLTGTVRYIAPAAVNNGAVPSFAVRVELADMRGVRLGMGGQLTIER